MPEHDVERNIALTGGHTKTDSEAASTVALKPANPKSDLTSKNVNLNVSTGVDHPLSPPTGKVLDLEAPSGSYTGTVTSSGTFAGTVTSAFSAITPPIVVRPNLNGDPFTDITSASTASKLKIEVETAPPPKPLPQLGDEPRLPPTQHPIQAPVNESPQSDPKIHKTNEQVLTDSQDAHGSKIENPKPPTVESTRTVETKEGTTEQKISSDKNIYSFIDTKEMNIVVAAPSAPPPAAPPTPPVHGGDEIPRDPRHVPPIPPISPRDELPHIPVTTFGGDKSNTSDIPRDSGPNETLKSQTTTLQEVLKDQRPDPTIVQPQLNQTISKTETVPPSVVTVQAPNVTTEQFQKPTATLTETTQFKESPGVVQKEITKIEAQPPVVTSHVVQDVSNRPIPVIEQPIQSNTTAAKVITTTSTIPAPETVTVVTTNPTPTIPVQPNNFRTTVIENPIPSSQTTTTTTPQQRIEPVVEVRTAVRPESTVVTQPTQTVIRPQEIERPIKIPERIPEIAVTPKTVEPVIQRQPIIQQPVQQIEPRVVRDNTASRSEVIITKDTGEKVRVTESKIGSNTNSRTPEAPAPQMQVPKHAPVTHSGSGSSGNKGGSGDNNTNKGKAEATQITRQKQDSDNPTVKVRPNTDAPIVKTRENVESAHTPVRVIRIKEVTPIKDKNLTVTESSKNIDPVKAIVRDTTARFRELADILGKIKDIVPEVRTPTLSKTPLNLDEVRALTQNKVQDYSPSQIIRAALTRIVAEPDKALNALIQLAKVDTEFKVNQIQNSAYDLIKLLVGDKMLFSRQGFRIDEGKLRETVMEALAELATRYALTPEQAMLVKQLHIQLHTSDFNKHVDKQVQDARKKSQAHQAKIKELTKDEAEALLKARIEAYKQQVEDKLQHTDENRRIRAEELLRQLQTEDPETKYKLDEDLEIIKVYKITGIVLDSRTKKPLKGVDIYGGILGIQKTGEDGSFTFLDVPEGTTYLIAPDKRGYVFKPIYVAGTLSLAEHFVFMLEPIEPKNDQKPRRRRVRKVRSARSGTAYSSSQKE